MSEGWQLSKKTGRCFNNFFLSFPVNICHRYVNLLWIINMLTMQIIEKTATCCIYLFLRLKPYIYNILEGCNQWSYHWSLQLFGLSITIVYVMIICTVIRLFIKISVILNSKWSLSGTTWSSFIFNKGCWTLHSVSFLFNCSRILHYSSKYTLSSTVMSHLKYEHIYDIVMMSGCQLQTRCVHKCNYTTQVNSMIFILHSYKYNIPVLCMYSAPNTRKIGRDLF